MQQSLIYDIVNTQTIPALLSMKSTLKALIAMCTFSIAFSSVAVAQSLREEYNSKTKCYGEQGNICVRKGRVFNNTTRLTLGYINQTYLFEFWNVDQKSEFYMDGANLVGYRCLADYRGQCKSKPNKKIYYPR